MGAALVLLYWRDDLEAMQLASRRTGHADGHPAAVLRAYQPCDQRIDHPTKPDGGVA